MPFGVERTLNTNPIPVWQGIGKDIQLAQGGFKLSATGLAKDTVIPAGTPMVMDEVNRTASFLPSGTVQANGSGTTYRINKGHTFKVGDYLASGATGGAAYAITAIDTSNSAYDTFTVGTTIGALTAGDVVYASTATGASASALPAANGLLYDDTYGNTDESVSIVIRGTVYARRVPYNASIAALTGLKFIIYSQSK